MPTYKASEPKQAATYFVEPDIYEVEIKTAVEKTSEKNGNPMIKLDVAVILDGAEGPTMWEYLVFTAKASWKIDQVMASIGKPTMPGEDVNIEPEHIIGERGVALIGEEAGSTNPDHRFNKIERWLFGKEKNDWLANKGKPKAVQVDTHIKAKANAYKPEVTDNDDDIPF